MLNLTPLSITPIIQSRIIRIITKFILAYFPLGGDLLVNPDHDKATDPSILRMPCAVLISVTFCISTAGPRCFTSQFAGRVYQQLYTAGLYSKSFVHTHVVDQKHNSPLLLIYIYGGGRLIHLDVSPPPIKQFASEVELILLIVSITIRISNSYISLQLPHFLLMTLELRSAVL